MNTPGVITNDRLDPVRDGRIFSISARQNFASAYGQFILHGAWFTGEAQSAATDPGAAEFDRRAVSAENGRLLTLWTSISIARASAERVVAGLSGSRGEETSVDLARAALFAGYSYVLMAESFCQGATDGGPLLDRSEMLDRGIKYFARAHTIAERAAREGLLSDRGEALDIASAALVGRGRALLQNGDRVGALADASQVPPDFSYSLWYAEPNPNYSLSNVLWLNTAFFGTLAVAPAFRNLNDPRVPVAAPTPQLLPSDGVTPFWTQRKYSSYGASIQLASGLETRYLGAEAQGSSEMLALIQERRTTNGQQAYGGALDETAITREFMTQRARDFFLESKRIGDARRHPGLVSDIPEAGTPYHKQGFPPVGDQTCWPLPAKESVNR